MLLIKQKKSQNNGKGKNKNKILITVNVLGSAGPLLFVVNDDEIVSSIVNMALKSYAREGRRPVIGSNLNDFILYCPLLGSDALDPFDFIGAHGARNFLLCKRPQPEKAATDVEMQLAGIARKSKSSWKTWINKTLSLKIASH